MVTGGLSLAWLPINPFKTKILHNPYMPGDFSQTNPLFLELYEEECCPETKKKTLNEIFFQS